MSPDIMGTLRIYVAVILRFSTFTYKCHILNLNCGVNYGRYRTTQNQAVDSACRFNVKNGFGFAQTVKRTCPTATMLKTGPWIRCHSDIGEIGLFDPLEIFFYFSGAGHPISMPGKDPIKIQTGHTLNACFEL